MNGNLKREIGVTNLRGSGKFLYIISIVYSHTKRNNSGWSNSAGIKYGIFESFFFRLKLNCFWGKIAIYGKTVLHFLLIFVHKN